MNSIELSEAKGPLASYVSSLGEEPLIVIADGKPVAALKRPFALDIGDATESLASRARKAVHEPLLITDAGRPVAILMDLTNFDLESVALAVNPKLAEILKRSDESYKKHGGIRLEDVMREFGIKPRPRKRKTKRATKA